MVTPNLDGILGSEVWNGSNNWAGPHVNAQNYFCQRMASVPLLYIYAHTKEDEESVRKRENQSIQIP